MRACFAIVALALLAVAQGCGDSVQPVETPAPSVFVAPVVPTPTPSPTNTPSPTTTPALAFTATAARRPPPSCGTVAAPVRM